MIGVVVIQGGGDGAHAADLPLVESLQQHLGPGFEVDFPPMPEEGDPSRERWRGPIGEAIARAPRPLVLVGHSVGGYLLIDHLAREAPLSSVAAVCVIAAPFPGGDEAWTFDGFDLPESFGARLPAGARVFLYASEDDAVVPFAHRDLYAERIPGSVVRTTSGGHQLDGDLAVVARDIRATVPPRPSA
jgi:uncharacterized protein